MFFEVQEIDIVTKLTADISAAADVQLLPETQADFVKPFSKSRVLVCYKQSEFADTQDSGFVAQQETEQFELIIQARKLRGSGGIYAIAEAVRKSLVGFSPTSGDKIYLVKFVFTDRTDAEWSYTMTVAFKSLIIEDYSENTTPVLLTPSSTYTDNAYN